MFRNVLLQALKTPASLSMLSMEGWDVLVRQARAAGLLSRLSHQLQGMGLANVVPPQIRWHFEAADTLALKQLTAVRRELLAIQEALADLPGPVVVLKGAAYVAARLPNAEGRLFNDIDLLVPRAQLSQAESALMLAGWHPAPLSDYDRRYYRRWMHEIPPLQHAIRETVIDLHHAILPETARYRPDPSQLFARAVALSDWPGLAVLSPEDRILHSATHLFHDGELAHGLRDLSDLDLLIRDAAARDANFWMQLAKRADTLQLGRSLYYALRYTRHFLDTPMPDTVLEMLRPAAPARLTRALMDAVFSRALLPDHASCDGSCTPVARLAAYVRAHWLRMPAHLLIPHLLHKALISPHLESRHT
ncbi:MAG TPA: nucleotidyltransferase family protein [Thiobacillus sp.]|nr:nucleotidyltransferase family protein [Thiobacillus sp.]